MPWAWAALRVLPAVCVERLQVMDDIELEELGFEPARAYPRVHLPPSVDVTYTANPDDFAGIEDLVVRTVRSARG